MASLSSLTHNLFSCLAAEVEAFAGLRGCLCPARLRWDSSEPVPANADYQSSASKTMMSLVANVQFQRQLALLWAICPVLLLPSRHAISVLSPQPDKSSPRLDRSEMSWKCVREFGVIITTELLSRVLWPEGVSRCQ